MLAVSNCKESTSTGGGDVDGGGSLVVQASARRCLPSGVTRLALKELNEHLTCVICSGYLIDAVTIVECLHSYCRACLLQYLETSPNCPFCDVEVNTGQLHKSIRPDQTLQDLVYKLVPGLYKTELRRRKNFYVEYFKKLGDSPGTSEGNRNKVQIFDKHLIELSVLIYTPDELISLSLEYAPLHPQQQQQPQIQTTSEDTEKPQPDVVKSRRKSRPRKKCAIATLKELPFRKRYFRCPAAVPIGHLKKLLYYKLELQEPYQVELLHSDEPLDSSYTLMDVAYIYTWRRKAPMQLFFNVFSYEPLEEDQDANMASMPELFAETDACNEDTEDSVEVDEKKSPMPKIFKISKPNNDSESAASSVIAPVITESGSSSVQQLEHRNGIPGSGNNLLESKISFSSNNNNNKRSRISDNDLSHSGVEELRQPQHQVLKKPKLEQQHQDAVGFQKPLLFVDNQSAKACIHNSNNGHPSPEFLKPNAAGPMATDSLKVKMELGNSGFLVVKESPVAANGGSKPASTAADEESKICARSTNAISISSTKLPSAMPQPLTC